MAATNYTPIQLYYSSTASAAPTAGNLTSGELAINITDGKLYYKDNGGVVQVIATKGAGTIGGSNTQIQYNNAGALAGNAAMTFNSGTNVTTLTTLNLANALGATYGGTAQSTYTQGDVLYASASNTLAKLGIGTVNYILTSTGSVPQWSAPSSISVLTATNLAGGLGGSVPYQSAVDTTTFLAIGAANRVMTSTGTAPQWVTALTGLTGVSSSSITNTSLTSGRVVYSGASGVETDSANLTFNGTTLSAGGFSTTGLSTLVQTVKIGDSNFSGTAVFAPATPAKLYIGTGTVTDATSAIGATNTTGAISSLAITPIAATNTSVTYTNASTLYIAGAPSAGTNITITNPYALYVAAGASYFGGATTFNSATTFATDITVYGLTVGRGAGAVSTNTAVGYQAQNATATLGSTTAVGYQAAYSNTGGEGLTYIGRWAGYSTTTGSNNTATGVNSLFSNTTGANNVANGHSALFSNTTASNNTAVGYQAGYSNTTGAIDALGYQALSGNTTGLYNAAFGYQSLANNSTGTYNAGFGRASLYLNTTGGYNSASGVTALQNNTTGSYNTAQGAQALYSNTTASNNTAVGYQAGYSNTTGTANVFIGDGALYTNSTGNYNTAVGRNAGRANQTGQQLTCVGHGAGYNSTAGGNTFIGSGAGYSVSTGTKNTFIGGGDVFTIYPSGYFVTTGSSNTILGNYNGNQGGLDIRTSSNYIVLSDGDGNPRGVFNSSGNFGINYTNPPRKLSVSGTVLFEDASGNGLVFNGCAGDGFGGGAAGTIFAADPLSSGAFQFWRCTADYNGTPQVMAYLYANGGLANYSGNNTNLSDIRVKQDIQLAGSYLEKICAIPVKTFRYKSQLENDQDATLGVIAQDLEAVAPELVNTSGFGDTPDDGIPLKSIYQTDLQYALMKCIQELKAEIDSLKSQLNGA